MKNTKLVLNLLFIVIFSISGFAQKEQGIDFQKLDSYLSKSLKEWKIPGMAVAVVQGDSIAFAKGYGIKEFGRKGKVDSKTLFAVASNTKSFTAAALSQLVDEGKLNWDDKVIDYLPWFRMYNDYVTGEMTVRDLLCHRSGLKTFSGDLLWYETNYSQDEVIKRARYLKPEYGFRAHFGYSNIMVSAAGRIIPEITGDSWQNYIRTHFFKPLGMTSSLLSVKQLKNKKNVAMPHYVAEGKDPLPIAYMQWDNVAPAAAVISNVEDMSNWLILQMNNGVFKGDIILSAKQIWEMHSTQTPDNMNRGWAKYFPGKHFSTYGLGWSLFDYKGVKVVNHSGGADGMISQMMIVPEKKIGIVILTNSVNYLPTALMYYVLDDYFGNPDNDWSAFFLKVKKYMDNLDKQDREKAEKERNPNTKPALALKDYTGIYGGKLYGNAEVRQENGHLVLDFLPSDVLTGDLSHWQYETFKIKLSNSPTLPEGTVNFIIGKNGKVNELKVDIPNPDFDFTELKFNKINK
ncbi:MAG: serine hydrolase [Bacteroidales bacterium]|nr:serine hydrolase [Bacteroidales bacterium]